MPKSTRHKSHKLSKHGSKDYSDSEEDVKMMEKSSKDGNPVKSHRDSVAGEKRKISCEVREGKDSKDLNGEVSHDYASSKRRKEKADVSVGNDRWNGGGEDRGRGEKNGEKETNQRKLLKTDSKLKEISGKGESLRIESKNKSKRHESGSEIVRNEDYLASMVVDKEESKSKGESKRKPERDTSGRKELKDKDSRSEKEMNEGLESKHGGDEMKLIGKDNGKKQMSQSGVFSERQGKRFQENTERPVQDETLNSELERESEKKIRRRKEGSSGRDKHYDDSKGGEEMPLSSRGDHIEDKKYKDDKQKVGNHAGKYQEDAHKDDKQRDGKYRHEADKDDYHWDSRYREDGEKDAKHRDDKNREGGDRNNRQKDEKHHDNGERGSRRKDDKYREGTERDRRDDKYHDRDIRQKDDRYREDGDKDFRSGKERYHEDGDSDGIRRVNSYREDGDKDYRQKDIKYREDSEQDIQRKDRKVVDDLDTEKRMKDTKYWDEHISRDRSGYKSDHKRPKDDNYNADHHSRKSSAYDDSPVHDDRTSRYRDDQGRRRATEKEYHSDPRSQSIKDQRSSDEKKHANCARMDPVADTGRSTSKNADVELTSNHSRRRSSPTLSSHASRDHFRAPKQDESKYRDYNYEDRVRPNISSKDYAGAFRGSEKSFSSRSLEKPSQKRDGRVGELSAERHMKSDSRSSPLQHVDKSPSPNADRRQFSRSDVRKSIDVEESTYRSGSSRDLKDYSGKEGRGSREFAVDVLPEDEFSQADADTLSVSSPFMRNSHFNSSSKSLLLPPSFRTGRDSPLPSGLAESDSKGKSNSRYQRTGDPNMGRIQQNAWRGVPSWPSPMANGFLPFPHAPSPVGFHSVMQPFPASPMFGVRPSMELNHPSPYHISNADRFSGPGHPMGWRNPVDDSGSPFAGWETGNAAFGDEPHIYGRPDWDHSRNLLGGRGWETSGDFWKGTNSNASFDMGSSEKENNVARSADEALTGQSTQIAQNVKILVDQQAESTAIGQLSKSIENNVGAPLINLEETGDVATMSRKDDARLSCVYLSKLDISADLAEPQLFNECTGLVNMDKSMLVDVDDVKILYLEENVEAKMGSHDILSRALFPSADDSVFQKAISLYKRQKENLRGEVGEKLKVLSESIPNSNQVDQNIEDNKTEKLCPTEDNKTEKLCLTEDTQGIEDALPNFDMELDNQNKIPTVEEYLETSPVKIEPVIDDSTEKPEETISAMGVESVLHLGMQENEVKEKPLIAESVGTSDTLLPLKEKDVATEVINNNEEVKLLDTKYGPLMLNSDVSSEVEAMTRESLLSGSVNLSRIHHSPESTH